MQKLNIDYTFVRKADFYFSDSSDIPAALFSQPAAVPCLNGINLPLPSKKSAYTCACRTGDTLWLGAPNGLTRLCMTEKYEEDRVMFFSAGRDLPSPQVENIIPDSESHEGVWVLTPKGVSRISVSKCTPEEKAEFLTEETHAVVDRHGMVTQRHLEVPRVLESRVPYGSSDNSGSFTAGFAVGELCRYAVCRKKYGADSEKTKAARESALRSTKACHLLMWISGRGNGFVARTYMSPAEPVPDDGLFYRKEGGKAICLPTSYSIKKGLAGKVIDASAPVPEYLSSLYKEEGFTDDGIVYKGDTSSDEITHQYLLIYFAHEILGEEEPELDELLKQAAKNTLRFILDNGNELMECNGEPTTWAKWSKRYFATPLGWSDGCLNAAELLMYHKIVMHVTGEKGEWEESYRRLAFDEGYAELSALHDARFHISAGVSGLEQVEELMYGDNMLATCAYWLLCMLEEDPALKELYKKGYKGWNGTFRREHNPIYDFPYMLSCPEDELDVSRLNEWFRRQASTRLVTSVDIDTRHDTAVRYRFGGSTECSWLIPPDEHYINKYDRDPYDYREARHIQPGYVVESCYVYTMAYWLGRYYGFIEE